MPDTTRLTIPEEARQAARAVVAQAAAESSDGPHRLVRIVEQAVEAAAPLVVAAHNQAVADRLKAVVPKIVAQAAHSSRPGQMQQLEDIAAEVAMIVRDLRGLAVGSRKDGDTDAH